MGVVQMGLVPRNPSNVSIGWHGHFDCSCFVHARMACTHACMCVYTLVKSDDDSLIWVIWLHCIINLEYFHLQIV